MGTKNPPPEYFNPEYFNIGVACTEPKVNGFSDLQTAIIVDQGEQDSQVTTYAELASDSNRVANALNKLGLKQQDRVMLWLPNCIEFPVSFFGILKLGAIAVPSSILLTQEELNYIAKDSGAKTLITNSALYNKLLGNSRHLDSIHHSIEHVILIDANINEERDDNVSIGEGHAPKVMHFSHLLNKQASAFTAVKTKADDPAYLVYTSGTTGYPKGVLHAHRALLGRLPSAYHWFDYQEGSPDRILHSGKFNWTYVLGTAMMDPLYLGKTVVVYEGPNDASSWPKLIAKHQCTIFIGVPTIYRQIIQKTDFNASDTPSLRHCMCAGEHLSDEMLAAWKRRFKQDIYEAIGMSECSYYLSQHPSKPIRPGSAGFPQPGHQIYLLDENMQPVEDEAEGMLCIDLDDPGLFIEYWNLPETTQESRQQGYFLTGDYARRDKDGYIWFHGRRDDIINSFGFRISPHEIERVIKTHPDIADCVALEENVDIDKNLVVVCIILKDNSNLGEAALLEFSAMHLAQYKVPKKAYFVKNFPRTANGKVMRKTLKTMEK